MKKLPPDHKAELLTTLKERFEQNTALHEGLKWPDVEKRLDDKTLSTLAEMERTGGEPDVVKLGKEICFVDCSPESPKGRRSLCYDRAAWESRKEHKPASDAVTVANEIGIDILNEDEYRELQELGEFDLKTSSWVATPPEVRKLGGAIFCDRRFDRVFTYHNGAESYYAARGFRGKIRLGQKRER
ncbi:MAG: DUF4256 domain-containing protein [Acidobacteria bacterium]|nr:DUF4256 domain-containing protein [Acidobacteriota bacterium]